MKFYACFLAAMALTGVLAADEQPEKLSHRDLLRDFKYFIREFYREIYGYDKYNKDMMECLPK